MTSIPQAQAVPARAEAQQPFKGMANSLSARRDNDLVKGILERCIEAKNVDEKQRLFNQFVRDVSQHGVAEETGQLLGNCFLSTHPNQVILPAFQRLSGKGEVEAESEPQRMCRQFQDQLYILDQRYGTTIDETANSSLREALNQLDGVQRFNERIYASLEQRLDADQIESLNTWYERIKSMAPTRPHPQGPTSVVGQLTTAPLLALFDKIRDIGKTF